MAALLLASQSHAQAAPAASPAGPAPSTLGEVLVTAHRRTERLQDVGVAVTEVDRQQLAGLGIANGKDIAKAVPGVLFQSTASGGLDANLSIRGVSQTDFSPNQESPNSIYVDDVYVSSSSATAYPLYDLDRVEILRGPQGTLFGRASSGGLVNFLPAQPTKTFQGYAEVGYGSFNQKYIEAALGGPITDKIRFRIAGRAEDADGWWINTAPGGSNTFQTKFYGVRGQLVADLTDNLTARLSVTYNEDPRHYEGVYSPTPFYIGPSGLPMPVPANVDIYGTGPGNDLAGYRSPYPPGKGDFNNVGFLENSFLAPTLYLTWNRDNITVNSITNYTKFSFNYNEDCDGGPVNYCNYPNAQNLAQYSQELRISGHTHRLTWNAGVYFLDVDQTAYIGTSAPSLTGTAYGYSDSDYIRQHLQSISAFGQLEYQFSDKWRGIVGLRETHDVKSFSSFVYFNELGTAYGGTGVYTPPLLSYEFDKSTVGGLATETADMWSGKLELDFKPDPNTLIYGSVSRGIKGPGFNTNASATLTDAETPFQSEYVYSYELGSKLELFQHRLRIDSSLFYDDYHRFQGYAYNGLQGTVGNYNGYFTGIETEIAASLPWQVTVSVSGDYLDSQLRDVPTAYTGIRDEQPAQAPKETFNGSVIKTFDIGPGRLRAEWSFDYLGPRYSSIDNNPATYVRSSLEQNIRISYNFPAQGLELAFWVKNLTNAVRQESTYDEISFEGDVLRTYGPPRWFGGSIRKTF